MQQHRTALGQFPTMGQASFKKKKRQEQTKFEKYYYKMSLNIFGRGQINPYEFGSKAHNTKGLSRIECVSDGEFQCSLLPPAKALDTVM